MTKEQAIKMGDEVMEAARLIAEKYGMDVERGGGRYDSSSYKLNNIKFTEKVAGDESNSRYSNADERKMALEFDMRKAQYGMSNVTVGDSYYNSKRNADMKVLGWKPRNRKYPCLVMDMNTGDTYKLTPATLKVNLERGE